jgi:hypothetical protein
LLCSSAVGLALTLLAVAGCQTKVPVAKQAPQTPDEPPAFYADPPFGVGFQCVTIGCDTKKTLTISNQGGGKLGISKVRLSVDSSTDFTLTRKDGKALPTPDAIVYLGKNETLTLIVEYAPSDAVVDAGNVEMEHFDAKTTYLESVPRTDKVPLTARAFGSPAAQIASTTIDFGYVALGSSSTLNVAVQNTGEQEVLAVGPCTRADGTSPDFHAPDARDWGTRFANPGETVNVPIVFSPSTEGALFGAVLLATNDPLNPGIRVNVQGTAIANPTLSVVSPTGTLVMPPMRAGDTRTQSVVVQNLGGAALDVNATVVAGADSGLSVDPASTSALASLATATFNVTLTPPNGGAFDGIVAFDDGNGAVVNVPVHADVDAPQVDASPSTVDFDVNGVGVVQGWDAPAQTVTITNIGFGDLTVTGILFDVGSSSELQLVDVPGLPTKLGPGGGSISVSVLMQAQNIGPVDGTLLIQSDSIDNNTTRVPIHGDVITCDQGCPMGNATPDCSSGSCQVGACNPGFHNPDGNPANGCECGEDAGGDIPGSCGARSELGTYDDCGGAPDGRDVLGVLSEMDDVDLYHFDVNDTSSCTLGFGCDCFSDSSQSSVELLSAPDGVALCVNMQGGGTGCGGNLGVFDPGSCQVFHGSPVEVHHCGSYGANDDRSVTFSIMWSPGSNPQCGDYHVQIRGKQNQLCN